MKVGVLTGGGDAPGLNAAIRAIVKKCEKFGYEVIGIKYGWAGLLELNTMTLKYDEIKGIIHKGGTMIKTSRTNPLKMKDGVKKVSQNFKKLGLDALIAIGGDDTLSVAAALSESGLNVVGVPKTIDYDVPETEFTIGFDTAVNLAMRTIENLQDTAESHDRVFVVEIMGRHAGWIALYSGLAAGADLILIPEEPFNIKDVVNFVKKKTSNKESQAVIIVVAEGALIKDYEGPVTKDANVDQFGHVRLGGIGEFLAKEIEKATGSETRAAVPAHTIRGGPPTAMDRLIPTRYGLAAVDLIKQGKFGHMVALQAGEIVTVHLSKVTGKTKTVSKQLYEEAKIFFE
ncbi:ATP-dependent 6-phosphofructokinase [Candidatus Bathyarchaeota archaeon]|nr:ATP-dependent 6-phosphofructokinase [Candidatus Bathyarchaeota archaeon]